MGWPAVSGKTSRALAVAHKRRLLDVVTTADTLNELASLVPHLPFVQWHSSSSRRLDSPVHGRHLLNPAHPLFALIDPVCRNFVTDRSLQLY